MCFFKAEQKQDNPKSPSKLPGIEPTRAASHAVWEQ
jgi:hypothetical protein